MTAVTAGLFLSVAGTAMADEHEAEKQRFRPVEAFVCTFKEGSGWSELKAVNEEWNAWMDEQGANDYFAAMLSPRYHQDYKSLDFIWLGVWRDGNAMGAGTDNWITNGKDIGKKYGEISECSMGASYVSTMLRAPKDDGDDESDDRFVASFSNCSMKNKEDGAWEELMDAQKEWNAYADENGIEGSAYLWWPMAGDPDNDYGFKYIVGWDDHTMRGASWQKFSEGHWRKNEELLGDKLDCDNSRLYDARVVRSMGDDE